MLLRKKRFVIGLTTCIILIQTVNTLVVLSLNLEDVERLSKIASPDTAELLLQILRQDTKIFGKDISRAKGEEEIASKGQEYIAKGQENSQNEYGGPTRYETEHQGPEQSPPRYEFTPQRNHEHTQISYEYSSPRGLEYSSQRDPEYTTYLSQINRDLTTQTSKLRSYKIPRTGERGQSDLETIYERPVEKIAQYEPLDKSPILKQNIKSNIPGEVFSMYAADAQAERKSTYDEKRDIAFHDEPDVRVLATSTPSLLRKRFGYKSVEQPNSVHIRQFGNRVLTSIVSGGLRSAGDLLLRPMEVGSAGGVPPKPGEFIQKRSMLNIQSNVRDIIADPLKYV